MEDRSHIVSIERLPNGWRSVWKKSGSSHEYRREAIDQRLHAVLDRLATPRSTSDARRRDGVSISATVRVMDVICGHAPDAIDDDKSVIKWRHAPHDWYVDSAMLTLI